MFWAATIKQAAYDQETISMLSSIFSELSLRFRSSSSPTSVRPDWQLVSLGRPPGESETPFDFTR